MHAVTRDNPILSGRTAEKVQAIVDYACENALYVQMMIPTDIRNRLIELAELDKEYRKNSMAGDKNGEWNKNIILRRCARRLESA